MHAIILLGFLAGVPIAAVKVLIEAPKKAADVQTARLIAACLLMPYVLFAFLIIHHNWNKLF